MGVAGAAEECSLPELPFYTDSYLIPVWCSAGPLHDFWTYEGYELTRNLSGNAHPQSPQLNILLWINSGIGACKLFFFFFFSSRKEVQARNDSSNCP